MIVPIRPPLDGTSAERFLALARHFARSSECGEVDREGLLDAEILWNRSANQGDEQQRDTYEAAVRVLLDLHRLGWEVHEAGYGIELHSPPLRTAGLTAEEVLREKARTRDLFRPAVDAQLRDPTVQAFVQRMEAPGVKTGKLPIRDLIADGSELHARLLTAARQEQWAQDYAGLPIRPYLQLVTADGLDTYTKHSLREIWRYFRCTWSIPQFATPGRQLLYLIRDAAHPCHAVMGIIGLNNTALQMGVLREDDLGWSRVSLINRLQHVCAEGRAHDEYEWLQDRITEAIADVEIEGLAQPSEAEAPDPDLIARLRRKAREFDHLRDETLRELARRRGVESPILPAEMEIDDDNHPPVADEMLGLESKPAKNPAMQKARRHLVARKRAALLADLLQARLTLRLRHDDLMSPERARLALASEEVGVALQTVLDALKSRYAGISILEVSTCGAVSPYNHMLGGKLAALLLFSPEIPDDYRRQYPGPSIISSQIKNAEVHRDNTLVYLATTSLYAQGSSQYHRLRLPAGIISPEQEELRLRKLGLTAGYGTLQFRNETRHALETFLHHHQGFDDINSIFGEGPSPKLRLLTAGLTKLGFPPDVVMLHKRPRLIYAASLTSKARDFVNARQAPLPDYLVTPEAFRGATERIALHWANRWLLPRLSHTPSVTSLMTAKPWLLSDYLPTGSDKEPGAALSITTRPAEFISMSDTDGRFSIWHQLAAAGPKTASEILTDQELDRLHIAGALESFIQDHIKPGRSIFLTGNAGDGKTHVLRRLEPRLRELGAVVERDATAAMRRNQIVPVLDRWRAALSAGSPFCIAINEYPLYLLRAKAREVLPALAVELDRQFRTRLVYGASGEDEGRPDNLLIIDLSLRNPLRRDIAGPMLDRILLDPSWDTNNQYLSQTLKSNLARLRDPMVKGRLLGLFSRLADVGIRVTMRELWILLARIVTGYRGDLDQPTGDGLPYLYFVVLFSQDSRFSLSKTIACADPAQYSHPISDMLLEERSERLLGGWKFGVPVLGITDRPDIKMFRELKRNFYFEHIDGECCFALEDPDAKNFREFLNSGRDHDLRVKRDLIHGINRAYCPKDFRGCEDNLYLWNGHRFHEQPTRSFLAHRYIPGTSFALLHPRVPQWIQDALPEYSSDHVILQHVSPSSRVARLKVDFPLFQTLQRLSRGLPRKLLPESDAFRLDAFLEALDATDAMLDGHILSAHLERRELIEIELSSDQRRYERIHKHV